MGAGARRSRGLLATRGLLEAGLALGGMVVACEGAGRGGRLSMLVSGSGRVRVQHPLWPRENGENMVVGERLN